MINIFRCICDVYNVRIGQCKTLTLRNLSRRMSSGNTPLLAASTGMPLIAAITKGSSFAGENKKRRKLLTNFPA